MQLKPKTTAGLDNKALASFQEISEFFLKYNVEWWVEGGTALSLWRDKKILEWDHDLDIAIWYDHCPKYEDWVSYFDGRPFQIVFQKGLTHIWTILSSSR